MPIELGGTGALQAIQLAAYVTLYEPALLLLDEPDAHLHPGNQKQLVDLVFDITQTTSTQVVMASHSRHVLDRVGGNPSGQIVWIKDGVKQESSEADLPLLMDIGALDEFEELSKNRVKRLIFCEDTKIERLRYLVESSGVDPDAVHFVSFNGIDNLTAAGTVVEFFLRLGPDRKAVVYRDGDCMTANEKAWLKGKAEKELPNNAHLYISRYTDIEHGLCDPNHVAECLNIGAEEAGEIVGSVVEKYQARLASKATAKRSDLKAKVLRDCTERDSTEKLFADGISFEYALGKILLPRLREELADRGMDASQLDQTSSSLADGELAALLR